jgi:hypothetical protein
MDRIEKSSTAQRQSPDWHIVFLDMLPAISRQAAIAFRAAPPVLREELIEAVTANCLVAFVRLIELRKSERAFPSALARYGILQVRAGRRVGSRLRAVSCCQDTRSVAGVFLSRASITSIATRMVGARLLLRIAEPARP